MIQNNPVSKTSQEAWLRDKTQHLQRTSTSLVHPQRAESFLPDHIGIQSNSQDVVHTGCLSYFGPSLKSVIDHLRQTQGSQRVMALVEFQGKLDKMDPFQLRSGQAYLGQLMASSFNTDDELLGALLSAVNKELSSRESIRPLNLRDLTAPRIYPQTYPRAVNPRAIDFQNLSTRTVD